MPIYVYRCTNCEVTREVEQRITEDALVTCPDCNADALKRVIQPVGVAFKGSGFHINDYAPSSGASSEAPAETSTASKPAESSSTPAPAPTSTETTS